MARYPFWYRLKSARSEGSDDEDSYSVGSAVPARIGNRLISPVHWLGKSRLLQTRKLSNILHLAQRLLNNPREK